MSNFGEHLHQWRKESGLSLRALADKADISPTYIDNLEKNKPHSVTGALPQPSRDVIKRIAAACGVPGDMALRAAGYLPEEKLETVVREVTTSGQYDVVTFDNAGAGIRSVQGEAIQVQIPEDQLEILKQFNANFAAMMQKMTKTE
jgi:transcriptional regulator with XRE-family HTH domain